jgi:hypothetical protein
MHRTLNTIRLFVAATALLLPVLAAPIAQAQSVKGSGDFSSLLLDFSTEVHGFTVNASIQKNGQVAGKLSLNETITVSDGFNFHIVSAKETFDVESLSVIGNQATVWARSQSSGTLYAFSFTDNGDGSVTPDSFDGSPLLRGDVKVTP